MYTNPLYLKITNLKERGAAVAILAVVSKLLEKKRIIKGASFSVKARSPKFSNHAKTFLAQNLKMNFTNIQLHHIKSSLIIVTITPK